MPDVKILSKTNFFSKTVAFTTVPLPVPVTIPGLQLWLDAADSSTLFDATAGGNLVTTDGAAVARWQDKSGNNRHATQGTANARPILKTSIKNGRNVLRFDGSNDLLGINSIASFFGGSHTMFAVGQTSTGGKNSTIEGSQVMIAGVGWHQTIQFGGFPLATTVMSEAWTAAGGTNYNSSLSYVLSSWVVATRLLNSAATRSIQLFANSVPGPVASWTGSLLTPSEANIGAARATGSYDWFLNGQIAELIIYNTVLTTTQRQAVETYLINKWAIEVPLGIPGLQLWLDASDNSTLFDATTGGNIVTTDGAAVARWQDKSGNNRHAIQQTVNNRPTKTNNLLNFDGSNDFFSINNFNLNMGVGSSGTFVIMANGNGESIISNVRNQTSLTGNGKIDISNQQLRYSVNSRASSPFEYNLTSSASLASNTINFCAISYVAPSTTGTLSGLLCIEGVFETITNSNYQVSNSTTFTTLEIGRYANSIYYTRYFAGNINKILYYNRNLTPNEITALYNWSKSQ